MKRIFHYTTGRELEGILESGQIQAATEGVFPPEKPAVWLSVAPVWEHTATKGIIEDGKRRSATLAEMVEEGGCLVRIEIDPKRVNLIYPLKLSSALKTPKRTLIALAKVAREAGANPNDWRAVAGSIPLEAFVSIELAKEVNPIKWIDSDSIGEE